MLWMRFEEKSVLGNHQKLNVLTAQLINENKIDVLNKGLGTMDKLIEVRRYFLIKLEFSL
ncbi:1261_t:CDS:2 [Funneliformis geosporum]|uniref:1261_t:CDS:1 n=1 Tax=Funneliformis geosporum TaxID=1117311 RepID=A0A9W4SKP4_9GLOM|nr:1261_t:CDS:2 [Funneliformis geosporum]